jgi:RNA polymerase sigma factor (sigma-70 family)
MPKSQPGTILKYLRDLLEAKGLAEVPDCQLLERFVADQEDTAFNALLRRHGPMVLSVARRVVGNDHDAEDVFQATFIILARKANAIRKKQAVGGWLHGVAQRLAVKARAQASRRNSHEKNVASMKRPNLEPAWTELNQDLDSALQELPAKYREALVLCYLQGQTQEQSAKQLGCPLGTVRSRLAQGRKLLRDRLARRGLPLSGGAFTTVLATAAAAQAVPIQLRHMTLKAAVQIAAGKALAPGLVSSQVIALVNGGIKAMAAAKIKLAGFLVVSASLLSLGAGALGHHLAASPDPSGPADPALRQKEPKRVEAKVPPEMEQAKPDEQETISVQGWVKDMQGQPVPGANVAVFGFLKRLNQGSGPNSFLDEKSLAMGVADKDGFFRLQVARQTLERQEGLHALAIKTGHGLSIQSIPIDNPRGEIAIQLQPEKIIHGRLVDLQGQPAAGVLVKLYWVSWGPFHRAGSVELAPEKEKSPFWPEPVLTDKDGRFTIKGLSPRLQGFLKFESDLFAPQQLEIKAGAPDKLMEVTRALPPSQLIEGVVTAADTGKPLAHAKLHVRGEQYGVWRGETDDKGRYRLNVDPGKEFTIGADPGKVPYLPFEKSIKWPQGAVKQTVDLALPRGVLLRVTVKEQVTGKLVPGAYVHDFDDDYRLHRYPYPGETGPDGVFEIAVPPGKGTLLIKHSDNSFIALQTTRGELSGRKPGGARYYPDALISFDAKLGIDVQEVHAELRRGVSIKGQVVRPDGTPVAEGTMLCWNQLSDAHQPRARVQGARVHNGHFDLRGCDPHETYVVHFLDPQNQLGATVQLSVKEAEKKPVIVRLAACGNATGRIVNKNGKPLVKARVDLFFVARLEDKKVSADEDFVGNVDRHNHPNLLDTDTEGRFTFPALIPGAIYRIYSYGGQSARDFTVQPGETLNLGDLVFDRSD